MKRVEDQKEQIKQLHSKAQRIIAIMGVERKNTPGKVSTIFLGPDRYQVCQVDANAPIRLTVGAGPCWSVEPITDLEGGGEVRERRPTELAKFYPDGEVFIKGKKANPHKQYIINLPQLTAALELWDDVLRAKSLSQN